MGTATPTVSGSVGNFKHLSTLSFLMCIKFRTAHQTNFPLVWKIWESTPRKLPYALICQRCAKPEAASGTPTLRIKTSGVFLQIPIVWVGKMRTGAVKTIWAWEWERCCLQWFVKTRQCQGAYPERLQLIFHQQLQTALLSRRKYHNRWAAAGI